MNVNRRQALTLFAGAAVTALAQGPPGTPGQAKGKGKGKGPAPACGDACGPALPLKTTGLEHIGVTVTNPEALANFYGRIFDPQLFKEREIPNRFYCRMGKAYLAFGTNANVTEPKIDHICALVEDYRAQDVRTALEAQGITMAAGPTGMPSDADGMRLQLLGVPGGLAGSIIPARRIAQDDAIVQAIGIDHITQWVSNVDVSVKFYATFFGKEASRSANKAVFNVAQTQLVLEKAPAGEAPRVHHFTLRVAGLNRKDAEAKLTALGAKIMPSGDEGLLRFQDIDGLLCELKPA
jgi:catechol 2,3-dioxygenase-like lactoylglutathione lyase family enzyme